MKKILLLVVFSVLFASYARAATLCGNPFPPTAGTGTVVTGSSDCFFSVTGGTSPVTVTFGNGITYANAPLCVCSDLTSATQTAKPAPTTTTVVVTSTGTDSFACSCAPR